jgi:hypothetical protein
MGHSNLYTIMKEAKYPIVASTHSSTNNINEFPVEPGHSQLYKIMSEAKYPVSANLTTSSTHSSLTNISSEPSKPSPQHYDFTTMTTIGQQPQPQHVASHSNLYTIMKEVKDHEAAAAPSSTSTVISRETNKKMAPHLPPQSVNSSSSSSLNQNFTPELGHSNLYTIMKEAKYPVAAASTTHSSITNVNPTVAAANLNRDFVNEQGHSNLYTVMKEAKESSAGANKNINVAVISHFI